MAKQVKAYGEIFVTDITEQFSVILSNDSQSFVTDSSNVASAQSYYTDVIVYQGSTKRTDFTIGDITSNYGITVSKDGSRITFSTAGNTRITSDSGSFDIPITLDDITVTKTFSWNCAKMGLDGTSSTVIQLSNENVTFPATSVGTALAGNTDVLIFGYVGTKQIETTVGKITGLPTGMSANIIDNGKTTNHIIISVTSSMNTQSGVVDIPITANGITITKKFSYTLSRQGVTGNPAKSADISPSSLIFKCSSDSTEYSPSQIYLTPLYQNCSFGKWQYSIDSGSTWTDVTSGQKGLTVGIVDNVSNCLTVNATSELFTDSAQSVVFKLLSNTTGIYDIVTISRLRDGNTGDDGISVQSVIRYYILQSSEPDKPTTNPPDDNWTTTEPTYSSDSTDSLYFVDCTIMTDGSFKYSDVSKSSSYEASKDAWNKAKEVENITNECYLIVNKQAGLIDEKISKSQVIDTYVESVDENGETVLEKKTTETLVNALNQTTKTLAETRSELSKSITETAEDGSAKLQSYKNEMAETINGLEKKISESTIVTDSDGKAVTMEEFYSDYKATAEGFTSNVVSTVVNNLNDEKSEFRSTIQQLANGTVEEYVNNSDLSKTVTEIQKSYQGISVTFKDFFNRSDNAADGVSINTDGITVYRTDSQGNTIGKSVLGTNGLEGYAGTNENSVRIFYFTDKGSGQSEVTIDTGVINFKSSVSDSLPSFKTEIQNMTHSGANRKLLVFLKP